MVNIMEHMVAHLGCVAAADVRWSFIVRFIVQHNSYSCVVKQLCCPFENHTLSRS